ncbi:MAG: metal-dependent hydrolase [Gammaproteobacteria bacterium]|nr:MAG: metal-dependent hydrolase [Gammaproteobacteria bacterium]
MFRCSSPGCATSLRDTGGAGAPWSGCSTWASGSPPGAVLPPAPAGRAWPLRPPEQTLDPVTHLLGGTLCGHLAGPRDRRGHRAALLTGAVAGLFPDIDYLGHLFQDPLTVLNNHRGVTHSFLLVPLWAGLLGWVAGKWPGGIAWRRGFLVACAAVSLHILLDLITPYGTRILAPLDRHAFTLGTTFVIDPVLTLILGAGLAVSLQRGSRAPGALALLLLAALITFQGHNRQEAEALARSHARMQRLPAEVLALPQPFSAWNWKLVLQLPGEYRIAHVNLGREPLLQRLYPRNWPLGRTLHSYVPAERASWQRIPRYGPDAGAARVRAAWESPAMAPFRSFARLPSWYGNDRRDGCIWFTDQRYTLPWLPPPFLFAACPEGPGRWRLQAPPDGRWPLLPSAG